MWKAQKKEERRGTERPERRKGEVIKEVEREEETMVVKRRCVNPFFTDVFEEFIPVEVLE